MGTRESSRNPQSNCLSARMPMTSGTIIIWIKDYGDRSLQHDAWTQQIPLGARRDSTCRILEVVVSREAHGPM